MNILEFDNHPLSAIILHPSLKQKIYRAVGCLGEKLDFFSPLGFEANCNLITKPTNQSHIQSGASE